MNYFVILESGERNWPISGNMEEIDENRTPTPFERHVELMKEWLPSVNKLNLLHQQGLPTDEALDLRCEDISHQMDETWIEMSQVERDQINHMAIQSNVDLAVESVERYLAANPSKISPQDKVIPGWGKDLTSWDVVASDVAFLASCIKRGTLVVANPRTAQENVRNG